MEKLPRYERDIAGSSPAEGIAGVMKLVVHDRLKIYCLLA